MHSPLLTIGEPRTRGHRSKQKRQDLFTQRVKDIWNELPNEVVETGTIKSTTEEDDPWSIAENSWQRHVTNRFHTTPPRQTQFILQL